MSGIRLKLTVPRQLAAFTLLGMPAPHKSILVLLTVPKRRTAMLLSGFRESIAKLTLKQ
jgi:hypothetical protein